MDNPYRATQSDVKRTKQLLFFRHLNWLSWTNVSEATTFESDCSLHVHNLKFSLPLRLRCIYLDVINVTLLAPPDIIPVA